MSASSLIAEFTEATWPNPFNHRERILFDYVALSLEVYDDDIRLQCIRTLLERGSGQGSRALDWLCALADKHGVELNGTIEPCGGIKPRLNVRQLTAWYHGFTNIGRTINRRPNVNHDYKDSTASDRLGRGL